jgi:hypothetical protein
VQLDCSLVALQSDLLFTPVNACSVYSLEALQANFEDPFLEPPTPIGVFGSVSRKYSFPCNFHISAVMKCACILAYPGPTHYMRVHIAQIIPHSNCITAAISLKLGGAKDKEIVFRLQWHVGSVPTYLRECFQQVGTIVQTTLLGAYRTSL